MDKIELHHLEVEAACIFELRIDRNEIILPVNLQPMSRVEENTSLGAGECRSKSRTLRSNAVLLRSNAASPQILIS